MLFLIQVYVMLKQAFAATLLLAVMLTVASAQVVGTSKLTLSTSVIYVHQGNSTNLNGTVALVNGTASGSTLVVVNSKNLSAEGISVYLPNGYGVPSYSPRMTVSVNATTPVGNYTIIFYESGDDQALNNTPATLVVLSPSTPLPTTSVTPTTITPSNGTSTAVTSTPTTVPTTVSGTAPPGIFSNMEYVYLIIAAIIIVIIIIAAVVAYYSKHR